MELIVVFPLHFMMEACLAISSFHRSVNILNNSGLYHNLLALLERATIVFAASAMSLVFIIVDDSTILQMRLFDVSSDERFVGVG